MKRIYISYNYIIYLNDTVVIPVTLKDAKYRQSENGWTVYDQTNASFFVDFRDIVNFYNSERGTVFYTLASFTTFLNSTTGLRIGESLPTNPYSTGWASYVDTAFTSGSPFNVSAGVTTKLPNNAGTIIDGQKPDDITTFYTGSLITGRNGDSLDLMIYFKVLPSSTNAELDVWIDIGGAIGEIYLQTFYFRGATTKGVLYSLPSAYTLNTWEANGGSVYVKPSVNMDFWEMKYNFDRTHKAI